jgi:hypothetical protein
MAWASFCATVNKIELNKNRPEQILMSYSEYKLYKQFFGGKMSETAETLEVTEAQAETTANTIRNEDEAIRRYNQYLEK